MAKIHWETTSAVARRVSGDAPLAGTYHERRFELDAPGYVARASDLVSHETGLELPGAPDVGVISRARWVDTNIAAFSELLAPLRETMEDDDSGNGALAGLGGRFMGAEIGAVLGFLSRRVLGQYELVLPTSDGKVGDSVYFVGVNVLGMERAHEFRPSHFRLWVALHETAHRAQFTGVPWMRGYFLSLVDELIGKPKKEKGRLLRIASEVQAARARGEDPIDDLGLLGLIAGEEQREVLNKVQALMSLLEGHGHVVMDRIGEREIVDVQRMSRVLTARRDDSKNSLLMKLIGMELKLRQYEDGARFIKAVERRAGWDALSMAWESPESLPTLEEIEEPEQWLTRMSS